MNSQFINNEALQTGGAITYDSYRPFLENITYVGNNATYEDNLASYAVKVMQVKSDGSLAEKTELNDIPSGLVIDNQITLALVNVEGHIISSDSYSSISIMSISPNAEIEGQNVATLVNGVATFTDTIFTSSPGNTGVRYMIRSSAINYRKVKYIDSELYRDQVFEVNFRWCKPGEIQVDNTCGT